MGHFAGRSANAGGASWGLLCGTGHCAGGSCGTGQAERDEDAAFAAAEGAVCDVA